MNLTPEQTAAIEKLAHDVLIMDPQDRKAAMLTMVEEYAKAVRAKYPDFSEDKIESAVARFGDLILRRFQELDKSIGGRAGHA